jgi:hypothetical protein
LNDQIVPKNLKKISYKFVWTWTTNCSIFRVYSFSGIHRGRKKKISKKLWQMMKQTNLIHFMKYMFQNPWTNRWLFYFHSFKNLKIGGIFQNQNPKTRDYVEISNNCPRLNITHITYHHMAFTCRGLRKL